MGDYTQFLSQKGNSISPEDENYIQELLEIASSFRTFDAALDEFIVQKGYTGNLADTDAKVRFIKCKFDEAGIPIEARVLKGWFQKHTQAEKRDYAMINEGVITLGDLDEFSEELREVVATITEPHKDI